MHRRNYLLLEILDILFNVVQHLFKDPIYQI